MLARNEVIVNSLAKEGKEIEILLFLATTYSIFTPGTDL